MKLFLSRRFKAAAVLVGVAVLVAAAGPAAAAALSGDAPEGADQPFGGRLGLSPRAFGPGPGLPGLTGRAGWHPGPPGAPPELTDEQETLLSEAREVVAELGATLDQAAACTAAEDWAGAQAALLDYVEGLAELDALVAGLEDTTEEGDRFPLGRVVGAAMDRCAGHLRGLARIWANLPEDCRAPVSDAVSAAAGESEHRNLWERLLALCRGEGRPRFEPGQAAERLERTLEMAERRLEQAGARLDRLQERLASLEERLAGCSDESRRERLLDLQRLTELEMEVCRAHIVRSEFAVQMLQERLAELGENAGTSG